MVLVTLPFVFVEEFCTYLYLPYLTMSCLFYSLIFDCVAEMRAMMHVVILISITFI